MEESRTRSKHYERIGPPQYLENVLRFSDRKPISPCSWLVSIGLYCCVLQIMIYWFLLNGIFLSVEGGELFCQIVERGSYNEQDARSIVKQIVQGVAYLHSKDIAHRDLKVQTHSSTWWSRPLIPQLTLIILFLARKFVVCRRWTSGHQRLWPEQVLWQGRPSHYALRHSCLLRPRSHSGSSALHHCRGYLGHWSDHLYPSGWCPSILWEWRPNLWSNFASADRISR